MTPEEEFQEALRRAELEGLNAQDTLLRNQSERNLGAQSLIQNNAAAAIATAQGRFDLGIDDLFANRAIDYRTLVNNYAVRGLGDSGFRARANNEFQQAQVRAERNLQLSLQERLNDIQAQSNSQLFSLAGQQEDIAVQRALGLQQTNLAQAEFDRFLAEVNASGIDPASLVRDADLAAVTGGLGVQPTVDPVSPAAPAVQTPSLSAGNTGFVEPGVNSAVAETVNNVAPTALPSDSLGRFQNAIRTLESGGNYQAVSAYNGPQYGYATGAYQFLDATWANAIERFAPQFASYADAPALNAPPEVQDAVAQAWFEGLSNIYGGNLELVTVAHFAGEGAANQLASGDASIYNRRDVNIDVGQYIRNIQSFGGF